MAIEPKKVQDQDKLLDVLRKLSDEDPTFKFRVDDETGQTVISGMGELHLEIIVGTDQAGVLCGNEPGETPGCLSGDHIGNH